MAALSDNQRICILGCSGFIGSHLIERLLGTPGYTVCGLDRSAEKIAAFLGNPRLEFVQADAHDTGAVRSLVEKSDCVISLVALCNPSLYTTIPVDVIEINYTQPLEVVKMCASLGKWLIHFSTSEVYGKTAAGLAQNGHVPEDQSGYQVLNEESTPLILGAVRAQRWCYACAKQLLERTLFAYGFQKGLQYTIVRPFNFIGPRMDFIPGIDGEGIPRVLACFMNALMKGETLKLVDGGLNRRVFTYIDDAVNAVIAILEHKAQATGRIFNIGNPANEISIADLALRMGRMYHELTDRGTPVGVITENVSGVDFYGEGYEDSDRRIPDITKARTLLGWEPEVSLDTALRKSMAAYLEQYQPAFLSMEAR